MSRERAVEFVSRLRAADFEAMLTSLSPAEAQPVVARSVAGERLSHLTPAQRALLLNRLRQGK